MILKSAVFRCSSAKLSQIPQGDLPEFAFIGRSNVGKSSLINMLADKPGLAKVSASPGKTKLINHFLVDDAWYIVDLPGYGYAKASKSEKEKFAKIISDYISKAENLHFLFVLVDSRHEPQKIDLDFITMLGETGVPFGVVFTKSDKQSPRRTAINIDNYKKKLLETWAELPPTFVTSSEKREGREAILDFIGGCLANC